MGMHILQLNQNALISRQLTEAESTSESAMSQANAANQDLQALISQVERERQARRQAEAAHQQQVRLFRPPWRSHYDAGRGWRS